MLKQKKLLSTPVSSAVRMKTPYLVAPFLLVFFVLSPVATALFTSSYDLQGTISEETEAFIIGKTTIQGNCTGYPIESLISSPFFQEMEGFPLIGTNSITHLDSVIVAENIDITTATSLEDLIVQYFDHLTHYSDVDILTKEGLFLLGIQKPRINVSADLPYAVTTFVSLELLPDTPSRFFVAGADDPLLLHGSGEFAVLSTLSETSAIQIKDKNGRIRWSGGSPTDYLLIQDTTFSITQHPPLSLLPLSNSSENAHLRLSFSPANTDDITIAQLIKSVSTSVETNLKDGATAEFLDNLNQLNLLIGTASFVTNGALVFLQTNDTMTIDQSPQTFSSVGFVRFNTLDITHDGSSEVLLQGECTLAFLGNRFYTPQAKQSTDGIRFPYELLLIWALALGVFVYIRFFLRPPVNSQKDECIRRYALFIHLGFLVIAFLLLDYEVNTLFGVSALPLLFVQGFTTVTALFVVIEILIWVLGFFILAIPIQLLSYSVLRIHGIGKGGNGVWKAVGDLSIWVFCGLYLLLFLNIIFSLVQFNIMGPLG
jgi:hypothetical protein